MKKIFFSAFIFINLFLSSFANAGYFSSGVIIKNNADAYIVCTKTCSSRILGRWTGEWWTTATNEDQVSVCECLYDWPYCPYFLPGPSPLTCAVRPPDP